MTGSLHRVAVTAGQNNKEVTINNADAVIENAVTDAFSKSLTGLTSPYSLTTTQPGAEAYNYYVYTFTGALTGDFTIKCPTDKRPYKVVNNTTGGHNVIFKTPSGTGITIAPSTGAAVYCDGTNVVSDVGAAGSGLSITDGITTVLNATQLDFTSGATVTDAGGGVAQVAIAGGGGSGPWTLLGHADAASGNTIELTGLMSDTYATYDLICEGLALDVDDAINLQFGTGGGPSWTTSGYDYIFQSSDIANSAWAHTQGTNAVGAFGPYNIVGIWDSSNLKVTFCLRLTGLRDTAAYKGVNLYSFAGFGESGGSSVQIITGTTILRDATKVTAVRLIAQTNNFVSGRVSLLGYKNT